METQDNTNQAINRRFRLYEHPWLSLLAVIATSYLSNILSGVVIYLLIGLPMDSPNAQLVSVILYHILTVFVLLPFILRLPKGKRAFGQYLDDIGLSKIQPFFRLVLLGLSCYLILALSQVAASFVYRFFEDLPINGSFIRQVFELSGSMSSFLLSIPGIFEEMMFRGIILVVFLRKYPERKSIIVTSIAFGLYHAIGVISGLDPVWVIGQVIWASIIGLFYGYVVVRTRSLLVPMIVHYLGNVFISSFVGYIQANASIEVQVLYGVVISIGVIPTVLMVLWTRAYTSKWLDGRPDAVR